MTPYEALELISIDPFTVISPIAPRGSRRHQVLQGFSHYLRTNSPVRLALPRLLALTLNPIIADDALAGTSSLSTFSANSVK